MLSTYNELKMMLDGNWRYEERTSGDEQYLVLTNAGDIIAIYQAEQGTGLDIYYKSNLSIDTVEFQRDTAAATFTLIDRLF